VTAAATTAVGIGSTVFTLTPPVIMRSLRRRPLGRVMAAPAVKKARDPEAQLAFRTQAPAHVPCSRRADANGSAAVTQVVRTLNH
jgi:hypothetical protein